jgi:methionyl-tRNA synthetase
MAQAATVRAPRGTKILAKAFFTAAEEIAPAQRDAVIKAALAAIRDEMKVAREKAAVAKKVVKPAAKAPAKKAGAAKKIGRPVGSKNKPKAVKVPVVAKKATPPKAKKSAPKSKSGKTVVMPVEQLVTAE